MGTSTDLLDAALRPSRPPVVVDIGANPVEGEPPYAAMLRAGRCTVVGFEPHPTALAELLRRRGPHETYLPYAVGDGGAHTLHVCSASGMTSLLQPDPARLALFNSFAQWGHVEQTVPVQTRRLDDISEIDAMDLLKIDIQGGELMAFRNAPQRLADAVMVHTEVSFMPLYVDQPSFGEIDVELRSHGFQPHAMIGLKRWPIAPVVYDSSPTKAMHQLLDTDLVYAKDIGRPDLMTAEQLMHLALLADGVYGSSDLTHRCLLALAERGEVEAELPARYLSAWRPGG